MSIRKYDYAANEQADQSVDNTNSTQQSDKFDYDVFISYSHKNPSHAESLLECFKSVDRSCKVFYDRSALTTGMFHLLRFLFWSNITKNCTIQFLIYD